jgi:hypothetical protein
VRRAYAWFAKGNPRNQDLSCIVPLLVLASTRSCSTSHNLVDEGLTVGTCHIHMGQVIGEAQLKSLERYVKSTPMGVAYKFPLAYIMP